MSRLAAWRQRRAAAAARRLCRGLVALDDLAISTDKSEREHGYTKWYERHLDPGTIRTLVEIGVNEGGSMRMWRSWLPEARIIGFDIDRRAESFCEGLDVDVIIADGTTFDMETAALAGMVPVDVVVDDGSHDGFEQVRALHNWWPHLNPGGWFVIEDLETVWHHGFAGGREIESSIHAWLRHAILGSTPTASPSHPEVAEFHAYEQILFLRKGPA